MEDASLNGDWSVVRVRYAPQHSLGMRPNPNFGFIYHEGPADAAPQNASASTRDAAVSTGTD